MRAQLLLWLLKSGQDGRNCRIAFSPTPQVRFVRHAAIHEGENDLPILSSWNAI
jgi:hypothetical protein